MARIRRHRRDIVQSPLETYLREINEVALLTADEEKELAYRIADGDKLARERMVRANLRLVVNIARGYIGKGLGLQDLIEEGNLGLLRAVEGFDPAMDTRFSTYASYWIKQSIKRALVNTAKTIRIPAYMVELLAKWRRASAKLQEELGRPPTQEEIARSLNLLVAVAWHKGHLVEAERLALQSVDLRGRLLGTSHPDYAGSLEALALVRSHQGPEQSAEAEQGHGVGFLERLLRFLADLHVLEGRGRPFGPEVEPQQRHLPPRHLDQFDLFHQQGLGGADAVDLHNLGGEGSVERPLVAADN